MKSNLLSMLSRRLPGFAVICVCISMAGTALYAQVAIIVHPSVSLTTEDTMRLLDYYTGEIREWGDGQKVVVFDLQQKSSIKELFYRYLGKSTSRMKSIWMKRMLAGEGSPPEAVENEETMLKRVAETPGAIGFVSPAMVTNEVKIFSLIEAGG